MSANKQIVINVNDWNPKSTKYMKPRVLDKGSKAISIISTQTNRMLHLSTPLMMTWGISDYTDERGESDGKFSISLNFPQEDKVTPQTDVFLQKLQEFEDRILDDAERYSEEWWGKKMSREICKFSMYPIIKKNKDPTKPPSIRAKVPLYQGVWKVEIYDTKQQLLFPCEDTSLTPIDFVPKLSNVACGIQCGGIWIGGKGWGVTWKLFQCVVKPREIVSIKGCCIELSTDEQNTIETQETPNNSDEFNEETPFVGKSVTKLLTQPPIITNVEVTDSDDEMDTPQPVSSIPVLKPAENLVNQTHVQEPSVQIEQIPEPPVLPSMPKKIVKKTVTTEVEKAVLPPQPPQPSVVETPNALETTGGLTSSSSGETKKKTVVKKKTFN
jgi:hypothetical protein